MKYVKELYVFKDEIFSRDEIYFVIKRKLIIIEEEINDFKEKLKEKEMECLIVIK